MCRSSNVSLVPPHRAILRYYRRDTPYRAILFQGGLHSPKMVRYPPWYLVSHRHICAIPHFAIYRSIIVRYPTKTSTKEFCDTIAASIARYEKYRYWASKNVSMKFELQANMLPLRILRTLNRRELKGQVNRGNRTESL